MAEQKKSARYTIMQTYLSLGTVGKYNHDQILKIIGKQMHKDAEDIGKIVKKCKAESIKYPSMEEYLKTIEKPDKDEGDSFLNLLRTMNPQ
jgi:hypothetical protein